jgi:acyl-CoA reductase-like NAD-dependent aldehyde dehydrogenase
MQGEILASPSRTKEMILIKQPIGVAALITPVSML